MSPMLATVRRRLGRRRPRSAAASPLLRPVRRADRFTAADLLAEATSDIGTRPARLVMTLLGTVLGIGALVATIGFAQTTADQLARRFDAFAATQVVVQPAEAKDSTGDSVATGRLPWDAVDRVLRLAGVEQAALVGEVSLREGATVTAVPVNDPSAPAAAPPRVFAASADLLGTLEGEVTAGRMFDSGHDARADRVVVLGSRAAERLGVERVDSRPSILIDGVAYSVLGIFADVQARAELLDAVVLPTGTARADFALATPGDLQARIDIGAGPQVAAQAPLTLAPDAPDSVSVSAPGGPSELAGDVRADVDLVFLILSVVVLLAGGVGIANVTTLSVMERVGEIGLRRALGAARRRIAQQFVVESAVIGLLGGLLGAATGVLAVLAVSLAQQWTPVLDPGVAFGGALLGALIGLLAGSVPARRASRIEPIAALRGT
ncbi:ABC transporter permease [Rathayibacter sp. VKM Ac-2928]|uniref:ABC transporter permease n=1 Tax=Rathayibacter sp. VKM Ac-2928 TaxID=2929479 RepID=UPI001FB4F123|nr:ABC transporter permease [Rathayibacter sp. VKM Ac-2928]MCJ1684408.1 ABC transporter permease [Rathayibacter sp. VKM Ac-2928]